jgi:hypothetical protein
MTEPRDGSAEDRALWRRWSRMVEAAQAGNPAGAGQPHAVIPDAVTLAEFAENRLSGPKAAAVEAYLAAHPALAADVTAAGRAAEVPFRIGDAALAATIARAAALVPAGSGAAGRGRFGDNIVPFRAARTPAASSWPMAARWGALAASVALVSWLGFSLGSDVYGDLAALDGQSRTRLADELLDPPSGFFGLVDQSGT